MLVAPPLEVLPPDDGPLPPEDETVPPDDGPVPPDEPTAPPEAGLPPDPPGGVGVVPEQAAASESAATEKVRPILVMIARRI